MSGADFVLECARRELAIGKAEEENTTEETRRMKALLDWARLVCAHYGIEVRRSTGQQINFKGQHCYYGFF